MRDQPILTTTRLVLRPFRSQDAVDVERLAGAREIADTTLNIPHPYPAGAAEVWIGTHAASWNDGSGVIYAITQRDGGELTGAIGLQIVAAHAHAEIGYWIGRAHWNRGLCTEAGRAVLELAFGALRLHRVEGRHLVRNEASGRVMTKLGMRFEGVHRDAIRKWDRFEDIAHHARVVDDPSPDAGTHAVSTVD